MRKLCPLVALLTSVCCAQEAAPKPPRLPDGVSVESNISYDQYKETVMDIFQPARTGADRRRPGVLVIHGSGWVDGTKESVVETFVIPYLKQGFVVANVEYRLAGVAPAPAAVNDALRAAGFFHDNAKRWNVDPRRIVATGDSAGGHLALRVGMTPKSAKRGPV